MNDAYLFVAIGFVMMFFFKNRNSLRFIVIVFAFGVLFVGLNSMGAAMKPLAKSQAFTDIMLANQEVESLSSACFSSRLHIGNSKLIGGHRSFASAGLNRDLDAVERR